MERIENLIRLLLADGIGPTSVNRLLDAFGDAEAILNASAADLGAVVGIRKPQVNAVLRAREIDPRPELERAARAGVDVIAYDDPSFPKQLRQAASDPPYLLYVRGQIKPADLRSIGIVGTRRASRYGREQAERFGGSLARAGFTVVSGLARGIDSFAHRGTLAAGGRTLAVVGCGLNHMYPPENRDLAAEIAESGAVVSEFPMDLGPSRETFPRRNRIIAGLSLGVLIVEAPDRSGALITARQAMEMGREVFAIPGRIDQDNTSGCHRLIRDGAVLVRKLDDILEEIGEGVVPESASPAPAPEPPRTENDTEQTILETLGADPVHIDTICAETGLAVAEVSATLMIMEIKRLVRQQPGKFFEKV